MFIRTQTNGDRTYLLLVENARVGGRRIQRVLHRLGRLDELLATGQLDAVLQSLGRFSDKLLVLDAHARGASVPTKTVGVGPGLIGGRLWHACGIGAVLQDLLASRRFDFPVERAIWLTVLHRLMAPGSAPRACRSSASRWPRLGGQSTRRSRRSPCHGPPAAGRRRSRPPTAR